MIQDQGPKIWHPIRFTKGGIREVGDGYFGPAVVREHAVIILNNPLENIDLLLDICAKARCIVCADGGANQLKDLDLRVAEGTICFPNAICGDFDSLRPEVEQYYRDSDVKIVKDPDQYTTDLTKSLKYMRDQLLKTDDEESNPRRGLDIAIFGSLGGRADQAFSQLHHLYTCSQDVSSAIDDLYLITAQSVIILLEKGKNRIHAPVGPKQFTENAGIIPIGRPSTITTHGFEWDVTDWSTEFGTQMSTSNHIKTDIVEVETSERVLLTLEFDGEREP